MDHTTVPIAEFQLDLAQLTYTGEDLARPESVLAQPDGTLWISDGRGGVTRIQPDGTQNFLDGLGGEPNGLAMLADGSLLIANISGAAVQRLYPDGRIEDFLTEVEGVRITAPNFVFRDSRERIWIAVSTRQEIWWSAASRPHSDGFIILVDKRGARIVADGIMFTNEIRLDAREEYLYVAETMGRRILRYRVQPDGSLGEREIFGPSSLGTAAFVDGFTFDTDGNIWVTTVLRNGVGIITTSGDYHIVFEDARTEQLEAFEAKLVAGEAQPLDMLMAAGETLQLLTSVAFGGPDLRTVYIGSLGMNRLPTFRSPVPGLPMSHWT